MALNLANVELTDTFNTWRVRTNSVIGEAVSGTSTTSQTVTANTTFSGTVTATSFIGDGSQLTNAGSTVDTGTNNADLFIPFTGITSGTMTTANVDTNLSYNPSQGTLSANVGSFGTVTLADNNKILIGTGSDLEIYHDASNSRINDAGTGNLKLQSGGTDRVTVSPTGGTLHGGWTVTEALTVDGDATFNGNTTIIQSTVVETTDGLIHLASNNEVSDTLDIGFFGHYFNGSANQHAGVIRDSGTKEFYIFNEYSPGFEPENDINIDDGSFALANVHAAFFKGDGSQLTNAGVTVNDDTSTNTDYFLLYTGFTSGTATVANVSSTKLFFNPSSGQLNATDFNSLSDIRFKDNVETLENSSQTLDQLRGVSFDWKETGAKSFGLIAQEVEEILPEIVTTNDNGVKSIRYLGLIAYLIESNKELQERVAQLESKLS